MKHAEIMLLVSRQCTGAALARVGYRLVLPNLGFSLTQMLPQAPMQLFQNPQNKKAVQNTGLSTNGVIKYLQNQSHRMFSWHRLNRRDIRQALFQSPLSEAGCSSQVRTICLLHLQMKDPSLNRQHLQVLQPGDCTTSQRTDLAWSEKAWVRLHTSRWGPLR